MGCRAELAVSVRDGATEKHWDRTTLITHILKTLEEWEHPYL